MKTKFPATVMVFGVVSSEGHIMPPHIFEVGLKVNTKVYLDVLKSVVIPWCNQVAGGRPWVWQQDSAPAHKSKETQACLQKECYDFAPFSLSNYIFFLNTIHQISGRAQVYTADSWKLTILQKPKWCFFFICCSFQNKYL